MVRAVAEPIRKHKGSPTYALLIDGAHPQESTRTADNLVCQASELVAKPTLYAQVELMRNVGEMCDSAEKGEVTSSGIDVRVPTIKPAVHKYQYAGRHPDSIQVAGRIRYMSVKDRVWDIVHESVSKAEKRVITKDYASAICKSNAPTIMGCAIHPECYHFLRTR